MNVEQHHIHWLARQQNQRLRRVARLAFNLHWWRQALFEQHPHARARQGLVVDDQGLEWPARHSLRHTGTSMRT